MGRPSDARERILRTAAALFQARSYHAVGVDELCAAAGVRKGSFYHHFASKSELVKAVIDLHADAFSARVADVDGTPVPRLHAVADAIAATQAGFVSRFGRVVGCPFGNLAAELSTTDEDVRRHLAAALAELEHRLAAACRDVEQEGLLQPRLTGEQLAHALMAQYHGTILLAKVNASDATDLAPALHRVIDANLRVAAPARARPQRRVTRS